MTKQTLVGPCGIQLILDPDEIHFDDPLKGSPALVLWNGAYHKYALAKTGAVKMPRKCLRWLLTKETAVWSMVTIRLLETLKQEMMKDEIAE
jgi:hypothetical protein